MIAEKAWAKLVGSYGAMVGGSNEWVLSHVTDDPVVSIALSGYTVDNDEGKALWT